MKIGYPCINRSIGCTANSTFRLASYSEERIATVVKNNLSCLRKILDFNLEKGFLFFRMSSDIVPFASHPVCKFKWASVFKKELLEMGDFIKKNSMRISMHPDQFVLLNSHDKDIVSRSVDELKWHCRFLDSMRLDGSAKVQIHVGGAYGNKTEAIKRFIKIYKQLPKLISKRLVIENDDRLFNLSDCLSIHEETGIPIIFDNFHHACNGNGTSCSDALKRAASTWREKDGALMTDYSSQEPGERKGKHAEHIDIKDFSEYLRLNSSIDFDIMLEIKDKEKSAAKALAAANKKL
ncbi:MAG: UV damage repair endonuclease UvsE [Lentisphaerae bacterium GWF2_44_16]|nr:MAG: UV damage repair endonuclease UvsE [Lentisphaerae bacterium GWF2_44_16]